MRSMVDAMRADPLGPPMYLILPRHATFSAERELTCNSGLAVLPAHVISFDELGRSVLAECGGGRDSGSHADRRQMLLGHLLARTDAAHVLRRRRAAARLAARLDACSTSSTQRKDPAALTELLVELKRNAADAEGELLLRKMRDFHCSTPSTRPSSAGPLDPHGRSRRC